ncbi:RNA polymerase sigma factor [Parvibaculum sp.]|uniref:RNA polymerase sigma factor n=1 Tax=Parvibaculum sp. TaxID=2024848 RepID=UPI0034A09C55
MSDFVDDLDEHIRHLRRYARALVGHPEDADDLVQESLRRALTYANSERETANWRAYLFRILHNVRADHLARKARDREVPIDDYAGELACPAAQHGIMAVQDMERALGLLPTEQREVVLLVGLEGLTYREATDVLDVPIGTVMSRLSRGREALRRILADPDTGMGLDDAGVVPDGELEKRVV